MDQPPAPEPQYPAGPGPRAPGPGPVLGSPLGDARDPNREADLRQQALERLRYMNIQHAMYAWECRYRDPIAPYGLAFLYVQPSPRGAWQELKAATKLWLDGPEAVDPARLLYGLNHAVVQESARSRDFDLRWDLANRADDGMLDDAWFVGLGLSSLDTYSGRWKTVCTTAGEYSEIPGLILIVMIDSTIVACNRRGANEFEAMDVRTSQPLGTSVLDRARPWSRVRCEDLRSDPGLGGMLRQLEELSLNLWRLDNARLVNRRQGRHTT